MHQSCVARQLQVVFVMSYTIQDDLLVRVIFGEFVFEKQLVDFILVMHVHIVINIGEYSDKMTIANNSSSINHYLR